jgi:hypothetical protein
MSQAVIKNPKDLQIISNPKPKTKTNTMAKTDKAVRELKEQAITAGYILGGQAVGATANAYIVPSLLGNQSATIQQTAKIAIPAIMGLTFAASKNKHLRQLSLGFGVQSTLEAIKWVMPGFAPSEGFADSEFVYTDANGNPVRAHVTPNGQVQIPGWPEGQKSLPSGKKKEDESEVVKGEGVELVAEQQQNAYLDEAGQGQTQWI